MSSSWIKDTALERWFKMLLLRPESMRNPESTRKRDTAFAFRLNSILLTAEIPILNYMFFTTKSPHNFKCCRFVDVDLSCLEAKINLQTWVVLLDFLGLGAKVQDIDVLAGRETEQAAQPPDPGRWHVRSTVWSSWDWGPRCRTLTSWRAARLNRPHSLLTQVGGKWSAQFCLSILTSSLGVLEKPWEKLISKKLL